MDVGISEDQETFTNDQDMLVNDQGMLANDQGVAPDRMRDEDSIDQMLIEQLESYLANSTQQRGIFAELEFATRSLNQATADAVSELLWNDYQQQVLEQESSLHEQGIITYQEWTMPYVCFEHGEKPNDGWTLYLSMHGGGGAPAEVNDEQWENQKHLYDQTGKIQEGLYCAPRAPTNTWNMWHQEHIDHLFSRLITRLIILEQVNPNRVMLMGYSAGGDGVYQLAPRLADRFAAAAMSAGHPNGAEPYGLRNIGFTIHMGAEDQAYDRAQVASEWAIKLQEHQQADPYPDEAYQHEVTLHTGVGHWMSLRDAVSFDFMRPFIRSLSPRMIHWAQSEVTHERFYWLKASNPLSGDRVMAMHEGQTFTIKPEQRSQYALLLTQDLVDLNEEIIVYGPNNQVIYQGEVNRTALAIYHSLQERGDPQAIYQAEVSLPLLLP